MKKFLIGGVLVAVLGLAVVCFGDSGSVVNMFPFPINGAYDSTHAVVGTSIKGSIVLPVKDNYYTVFINMTANVAGGAFSVNKKFSNFIQENDPNLHPYPSQLRLKQVTAILSGNTTGRLFLYAQDTYDGTGYLDSAYLASVNFASLTAVGSTYVQDVQCDIPYIDLTKTNVICWKFKNTGATATRASFRLIYGN